MHDFHSDEAAVGYYHPILLLYLCCPLCLLSLIPVPYTSCPSLIVDV